MSTNMKKEQILIDLVDKDDNIIKFPNKQERVALATGGRDGDENWLENMERGSIFTARVKTKPGQQIDPMQKLLLNVYLVQEKKAITTNLIWKMPDERQMNIWVPTLEFSRTMELIELLVVLDFETKAPIEDIENGNTEGPV